MASKNHASAVVLDGSVAVAWCFSDEADPYADRIAGAFPSLQAVVPAVWHWEVVNALLMGERRKRSLPADTAHWLAYLRSLPVIVDEESAGHSWTEVVALARAHNLSSYDAAYLELALRRHLPLATLDLRPRCACFLPSLHFYATICT
ncbi:type II toxin-antitoxin system VapC family toxin [Candidatus Peregrinibacteria bacterium]|nr:type II toxin-antitoxin system VapC family toxin [Candidatus Peregrinibacteria bacterium]